MRISRHIWVCCMLANSAAGQQLASPRDHEPLLLHKNGFTVFYRADYLCPEVVVYDLVPSDLIGSMKRTSIRFQTDRSTPSPRATHSDYTKSGYDRGHMCPAADRKSSASRYMATFVMSNVVPMWPSVNRESWKAIEVATRNLLRRYRHVVVLQGATFPDDPSRTLPRKRVRIPSLIWRAALALQPDSALFCWVVANDTTAKYQDAHRVPRDSLRRLLPNYLSTYITH